MTTEQPIEGFDSIIKSASPQGSQQVQRQDLHKFEKQCSGCSGSASSTIATETQKQSTIRSQTVFRTSLRPQKGTQGTKSGSQGSQTHHSSCTRDSRASQQGPQEPQEPRGLRSIAFEAPSSAGQTRTTKYDFLST